MVDDRLSNRGTRAFKTLRKDETRICLARQSLPSIPAYLAKSCENRSRRFGLSQISGSDNVASSSQESGRPRHDMHKSAFRSERSVMATEPTSSAFVDEKRDAPPPPPTLPLRISSSHCGSNIKKSKSRTNKNPDPPCMNATVTSPRPCQPRLASVEAVTVKSWKPETLTDDVSGKTNASTHCARYKTKRTRILLYGSESGTGDDPTADAGVPWWSVRCFLCAGGPSGIRSAAAFSTGMHRCG